MLDVATRYVGEGVFSHIIELSHHMPEPQTEVPGPVVIEDKFPEQFIVRPEYRKVTPGKANVWHLQIAAEGRMLTFMIACYRARRSFSTGIRMCYTAHQTR